MNIENTSYNEEADRMKIHRVGIIMNGVTGRMGTNQHLHRSIIQIIKQGGISISDDEVIIPEPVLVGRNINKLKKLAETYSVKKYTTDLDSCLSDKNLQIYFDAQRTDLRFESTLKAIRAGKAVYCEKPPASDTNQALTLYREAKKMGVKNGVVQDKLWLPGLLKLKYLIDSGFFGQILSVQCQFGYWVFDGKNVGCQRPSWNYRKEDGGGIILDMFCHWRYIIDNLFGDIKAVSCYATTLINKRYDERGEPYNCTAEDAAFATFLLKNGTICQFNSAWSFRVRRDDLVVFQVDGTRGSAVAGLRACYIQPAEATPRYVWNPDLETEEDYYSRWQKVPDTEKYENAFKIQWELFLKHYIKDTPFKWTLLEGAKGVQLAEKATESWKKGMWLEIEDLEQ